MKFHYAYLVLLIPFLFGSNSRGQSFCHTPSTSTNLIHNTTMYGTESMTFHCLKVYMHVIRKSDGSDGQPYDNVTTAYSILLSDFNPHGINFIWDGTVDYIDNTSHFNSPGSGIFTVNNHTDGIDIYLFDDDAADGGQANGVGSSSEFYVSGNFWNSPFSPLVTSSIVSHEMGHVLFLWHTHHGTSPEGGDPNECAELVDGSNGTTCGDYVADTPADPHIQFNVTHPGCSWTGSGTDANGDSYAPDETNLMAYSNPDCMETFSADQGARMRTAIQTLTHLQDATVTCEHDVDMDLSMKDRWNDDGSDAGYPWTWDLDDSPDIWVRNQDDGLDNPIHENPEYQASTPVYVYVRVTNRGGTASLGTEDLSLYWTKAASNSSWPANWDGTTPTTGNLISTLTIPVLEPGEVTVLKFTWNILANTGIGTTWNNCLLARIENSTIDPITNHPGDLGQDVYQNNNISLRNCVVTNYVAGFGGIGYVRDRYFYVGNTDLVDTRYDIIFRNPEDYMGVNITDVAEVNVSLDADGWTILQPYLENREDIRITGNNSFRIMSSDPVAINGVQFPGGTRIQASVTYNFLTDLVGSQEYYRYHLAQKRSIPHSDLGDHWTGGIHFRLTADPDRSLFEADAGDDQAIEKGETATIFAQDIGEPADYNWYDSDGNLVYSGRGFDVSPQITENYTLEVIAEADGYKDYDEVKVNVVTSKIVKVNPNPVEDYLTIYYNIDEDASSAYLMLVENVTNSISINYALNLSNNAYKIDFTNFPIGSYSLILVVDGVNVDSETIIKN